MNAALRKRPILTEPAPPTQSKKRRIELTVAGVLWAAVAITVVGFVNDYHHKAADGRFGDLQVYVGAVRHMLDGGDLYAYVAPNGGPFTYPPFAALVFLPLSLGDSQILWLLWTQASLACVLVIAWVVVRNSPVLAGRGPIALPLLSLVLMVSTPVRSDLRMGQVSLMLACLILVDLLLVDAHRNKFTGAIVGLTAAIKLTPLALLPALWLGQRRRTAAVAAGTFVACNLLAWIVLAGETSEYWTYRLGEMNRFGPITKLGNQSVNAMLLRFGTTGAWAFVLWAVMAAAVLSVALVRGGRAWRRGERLTGVVVVGCATVAASPVSWTHHQIWTVLAAAVLVSSVWWLQTLWSLCVVLVMTTNTGAIDIGVPLVDWTFDNARGLLALVVALAVPHMAKAHSGRRRTALRPR